MPSGVYIHKKGKEHFCWKGGFPKCKVCGKQLSARHYKHCRKCRMNGLKGKNNPNWKGGKPKCPICGKTLSLYSTKYCRKHVVFTKERRENIRKAQLKRVKEGRHNNYKGGISKFTRTERANICSQLEYRLWREEIFKRDEYICQMPNCDKKERYFEAHHIKSWSKYPELRFEISNGITLCRKCHNKTKRKEIKFEKLFIEINKLK